MEKERVLNFLNRTAEAIAVTFGPNCETLIHDMSQPGHPILAIYNGHVSGRQVGSRADIYGDVSSVEQHTKEMLDANNRVIGGKDYINQFAVTAQGKTVKSTTVIYSGEDYIYALGINFDYSPFAAAVNALSSLSTVDGSLMHSMRTEVENQLGVIYNSCLMEMEMPLEKMKKKERTRLVTRLYEENAFSYPKAVTYIAKMMNVSRYTIYKYLHEIEESTGRKLSIFAEEQ